ncbi:phosphohydrolase [Nonlabens arenilitoris]|uniref:Phosphohydrolase n=1 Tax=Nonlabens arenilitoris TaxID=1217969 RepID=A0A2S7UDJ5_9FLAO|nr:HDIG domain-containing metalloprotein [Nonlabens arenilitoris]PQJ32700.1 phosphohydrolase [Nonlabens arenilitoris]
MKKKNSSFYKYQDLLIRISIIVAATIITIYFFPKSDRFKYDFKKGEPWQYETLYAPFSFPIKKSSEAIQIEIELIKSNTPKYFDYHDDVSNLVIGLIEKEYGYSKKDSIDNKLIKDDIHQIKLLLDKFYTNYYLEKPLDVESKQSIIIQNDTGFNEVVYQDVLKPKDLKNELNKIIEFTAFDDKKWLVSTLLKNIKPNIELNKDLTSEVIENEVSKVLPTRGVVPLNSRIIAQGEIVEGEKYQILNTLNETYQAQTWSESQYVWRLAGYIILVGLTYMILLLFFYNYRPDIYKNTRKLLFIFFNILTVILLTTLVVNLNSAYVYIVPVCILPLILKSFFDARVGLFSHVLTILILSFIVPNGEEFLFLQIIAGIVTILSSSEIYKRANLFITIGQIVLVYVGSYFAFYAINQGGVTGWEWYKVSYFILCGLAMLFVWPLIYIYENIFGLVSDVSLLELSDTNSKLLKELSNKAPGTFHHSLNVANIAESAADAINANTMLTRVGALYHDIGKMENPTYFSENQGSGINPHDDLDPEESASIIINHTIAGIEIAKKYKLPDRIIDFIRSHHGDSTVYFFYKKALASNPNLDIKDYQYPGPKPFSPETAILMIADSVEAASKSLKNPTSTSINVLVENIINKQVEEKQFINADITFKQIETIKSVIKKKLANIYHLRIEYPE